MPGEVTDPSSELEVPESIDALYHARGDEVTLARPLMTGDVLSDVVIPGLDDGEGLAIILTHPCSMRQDGVNLVERLMVARVRDHGQVVPLDKWPKSSRKAMLLPELGVEGMVNAAAYFLEASLCSSGELDLGNRLACLSEFGINLLQQRFIYFMTRFVVPTFRLYETCAHVFREAELQEEWVDEALGLGQDAQTGAAEFHEWIRAVPEGASGQSRQERLSEAQQVAAIRKDLRKTLLDRRADGSS